MVRNVASVSTKIVIHVGMRYIMNPKAIITELMLEDMTAVCTINLRRNLMYFPNKPNIHIWMFSYSHELDIQ